MFLHEILQIGPFLTEDVNPRLINLLELQDFWVSNRSPPVRDFTYGDKVKNIDLWEVSHMPI